MACKQINFVSKVEQPWSLSEKIQTTKALKQTNRQKYKAKKVKKKIIAPIFNKRNIEEIQSKCQALTYISY